MATKIFHGPPGSYKSSTAMWFEILPALRSGRVVVTNLQGVKSLEEIQTELKEIFPNTSRLLRISIGNDSGLLLMRNFFHWLPIGSMIFIDEIQDVYPNDRSFKSSDYDYKCEDVFIDTLPREFTELYHREQRQIKNNVDISEYNDDLGQSLFDTRDYLRYPRTLRECFMRHRHYNWDILLATPDIKEVNSFIRSVCEVAYCHSSKDAIPIPYYKRRPRILEHLPKSNGTSKGKSDIVYFKKIPLDVFKLYKSTATGSSTKSGAGRSPIGTGFYIGFTAILFYIIYMSFFFFDDENPKNDKKLSNNPSFQVPKNKEVFSISKENIEKNNQSILENPKSLTNFRARDSRVSTLFTPDNFINLPFSATSFYLNAVNTVYYSANRVSRDYVFTFYKNEEEFNVSGETLINIGYKIFFKSQCLVELRSDLQSHFIFCEPTKKQPVFQESKSPIDVSII